MFKAAFTVTFVKYATCRIQQAYFPHFSMNWRLFHPLASYLCRISRGLNKSSEYGMGMNSIKKQYFDPQDFELE